MADLAPSGIWETTIVTGTGTLTLDPSPVNGFASLTSAQNAKSFNYTLKGAEGFECGTGTYTHGSRTFSRDTVFRNSEGTTDKINFGTGTKYLYLGPVGEKTPQYNVPGIWEENQFFRDKRIYLGSTDDSYIRGQSDSSIEAVVDGERLVNLNAAARNLEVLVSRNDATEGPGLILDRYNASPSANDAGGFVRMSMRNSAGATITAGKIGVVLSDPSASTSDSRMRLEVLADAALRQQLNIAGYAVYTGAGVDLYTNGKTGGDTDAVGAEILANGQGVHVVSADVPVLFLNHKGAYTDFVQFLRDGDLVGRIYESGDDVVHYEAFAGGHPTAWDVAPEATPPRGTVLVAGRSGRVYSKFGERTPLVEVSARRGDPCPVGVFTHASICDRGGGDVREEVRSDGLGMSQIRVVGPVERGDLLWTSDVPGCAERQPPVRLLDGQPVQIQTNCTVAKAAVTDLGTGERLLPAFIYCG